MQNSYRYVIFAPYFGKLPAHFNLWLESCSYNKRFKFIVFTDDRTEYSAPSNVQIIHISFNDFRKKIQEKFDFNISLERPYKLCDFKPTYGYILSNYAEGYSYWGYCDFDLIFGNIEKFLPRKEYDKISYNGHLCLYRNDAVINKAFMDGHGSISYVDVLSRDLNFAFDEVGDYGINEIFKSKGLSIYDFSKAIADVYCGSKKMYCKNEEPFNTALAMLPFKDGNNEKVFVFESGKVYSYDLKSKKKDNEYAYVHFQKREMGNRVKNKEKFAITYDGFVDYPVDTDDLSCFSPKNWFDFRLLRIKMNTTPKRIKRELAVKKIKLGKGRSK